ncbi:MAG: hypothetical protein NVSMB67_19590 [Flavisolibacter sp.]
MFSHFLYTWRAGLKSALFCLSIFQNAAAQQYAFVNYTTKDGLINNSIHFIFQDTRGRIYFSTSAGISVYDGSRFTNYNTDNGLATSLINDIVEMGEDSLWLIPNSSNLHCLVRGKIKDLKTKDNFYPLINQFIKASNGVYYGLGDEGLFLFKDLKFTKVQFPENGIAHEGKNLYHGSAYDQYLFINSDTKTPVYPGPNLFYVYDTKTGRVLTNKNLPIISYSVKTPENDILVATSKGIYAIDMFALKEGKIELSAVPQKYTIPKNINASFLYFDARGNLWITANKGIIKITPNQGYKIISTQNGLSTNKISVIFQDKENTIWFGSEQSGITKLANQNLQLYSQITPGFTASDIYIDPCTDSVWLFNHNTLLRIVHNKIKFNTLGKHFFTRLVVDHDMPFVTLQGNIYYLYFSNKHLVDSKLIFFDSTNHIEYSSILIDRAGNIITISTKVRAILKNHEVFELPLEYLGDNAILTKDDHLWVITRTNKLYEFKIHPLNPEKYIEQVHIYGAELPIMDCRSIAVDQGGDIWVGTRNHGLFCYSSSPSGLHLKKHLKVIDGLTENFVQNLYCDRSNNIWACSRSGLDKITFFNNQYSIENITKGTSWNLNVANVQSDKYGTIWALTSAGILKIFPGSHSTSNYIPKLYFAGIVAGDSEILSGKGTFRLKHFQNNIIFHLAAPTFINDRQTRFSYKLEGNGKSSWTVPSDQPDLNFLNLAPGLYELKTKAIFIDGRYPPQQTSLSFEIIPPWWQTWWFRLFGSILIILIIIYVVKLFFLIRFNKKLAEIEKEKAVEKERNRIASDMHDELGSGLTKIAILSELGKTQITNKEKVSEQLGKISNSSRELVDSLQGIIWILNPKNDTLEKLVYYLREYTMKFFEGTGINVLFDCPSILPNIVVSEDIRRSVFLVVKETLNNAAKHSGANTIDFKIKIMDKKLKIVIEDNGSGFEMNNIREFGNGLVNMERRMKMVNGGYQINSSHQLGTETLLEIPI